MRSATASPKASVTALANVASELALLVVTAIFLAATNLGLFLVMALYFFIIFLVLHLVLSRRTTRFSRRIDEHWIASNETVQDTLVNSRQVYVSPNIAQFVDRFSTQRHHLARARAGINLTFAMPRYITEVALMLGIGALVLLRSIGGGASISASTIAIFIAGAFRVIASILPLQSSLGSLRQISEASKTALQILALPDTTICQHQVADLAEEAPQPPLIEISGLGYRYPGAHQLVFRNLSLRIEPRKFIAISGKSGVGKSTLADLILGLRKPTEGHIFYDGKDLDEYINDKPLSSFAYVSQNSSLFHGTLLENITFAPGELRVDNSALEGAIKGADLQRFVDGLPNGLETQLQPVTAGLSGGQVQRISLARAIYQRAQVVVLDEVTSALDGESEAIIADTISGLKGKVTLIVIAHREATIKDADLKIEL